MYHNYYNRVISAPVTVNDGEPFADQPKECRNLRLYPFQLQSLHRMRYIEANPRMILKPPRNNAIVTAGTPPANISNSNGNDETRSDEDDTEVVTTTCGGESSSSSLCAPSIEIVISRSDVINADSIDTALPSFKTLVTKGPRIEKYSNVVDDSDDEDDEFDEDDEDYEESSTRRSKKAKTKGKATKTAASIKATTKKIKGITKKGKRKETTDEEGDYDDGDYIDDEEANRHELENIVHELQSMNQPSDEEKENDDQYPEVESRVGILANKPGSGKSAVVLSLCAQPCATKNVLRESKGEHYYSIKQSNHYHKDKIEVLTNLIICNPKLLLQWSGYMKNFHLPYYVITNKNKLPKNLEEFILLCRKNRVIFLSSSMLHLLGTITFQPTTNGTTTGTTSGKSCDNTGFSYHSYRKNYLFDRVWFDRIFIDEIDTMEFPKCSNIQFHANFIWWISATPMPFLKNIGCNRRGVGAHFKEYLVNLSLFNKKNEAIPLYTVRCCDNDIDACIALPPYIINDIIVRQSTALRLTQGIIDDNNFQNMLRGDRLNQAISLLNINGMNSTIATLAEAATLWMDTSIANLSNELQYTMNQVVPIGTKQEETKQERIYQLQQRLNESLRKKDLLLERIASSHDCMICLDGLTNPVATKCCTTTYCVICIKGWLTNKRSCPNCRAIIDESKDFLVKNSESSCDNKEVKEMNNVQGKKKSITQANKKRKAGDITEDTTSGTGSSSSTTNATEREPPRSKIEALLRVLENSQRSLVYIECVGDDNTERIKTSLNENGIKVLSLAGHTASTCMKIIDQLREAKTKTCLIVSSIQHSAGFNLQFVDTIVMYQRMGDRETQIIGRGMRPGRTEPLKVYRILYQSAE